MLYYDTEDFIVALEDILNSCMKEKTEEKKPEKKTVSKSELKEMFKDEIDKIVNEKFEEVLGRIDDLEDDTDDLYQQVNRLDEKIDNSNNCPYDCSKYEDDEEDDTTLDQKISAYVADKFGLECEIIYDGCHEGLLVKTEGAFDFKKFAIEYLRNVGK